MIMVIIIIIGEGVVTPLFKPSKSKLALGLLGSLFFCLASLPFSSKGHRAAGLIFSGFSFMHMHQYRKGLYHHLGRERDGIKNFLEEIGGTVKKKMFRHLTGVQVLHYIPGRVRIYSRQIHNNQTKAQDLSNYLADIKEIQNFTVNHQTGSVLIEYSPEAVLGNKFLQEIEGLIASKYDRR
ncbi:HMA2 domain-containing protein [Desulforamulus ruminis]|uniref:Uncharacterized protein n=1 Tax=Desulforamulus ruminis (strain ATCC 23193 / DSM 2154 / NCIMB 8452 / DL) TaxID=696281 RepID=F6DJU1_DESRL|nr:hypothetical protein [Desulforamulus ruminis]AEG59155.1 hypothetical protein Desru_0878 [Desulforamulus ruminis DSM 2154]